MPQGYDLLFGSTQYKAASVTTNVQPDGTYEGYCHLMAGPGVERHLHWYAEVSSGGVLVWGGARVKENQGQRLGPGLSLSHSTQEIARFAVERDASGLSARLFQQVGSEWEATSASTWSRTVSRPTVALPGASESNQAQYSIAMYDANSPPKADPNTVLLPFSEHVPFGLSVTFLPPEDTRAV
jgi:hypothetical protein